MRLIGAASLGLVLALSFAISSGPASARQNDGQKIFRYDTFGDEQLWTGALRMHEAVKSISAEQALKVGLKVDAEALPAPVVEALKAGKVDLKSPATTMQLLQVNAVVGLIGKVDNGQLTSLGITCALCHSTVDNSFTQGIGRRLDGWPNVDLNVGAILGLSPALDANLKAEFAKWGPGKYDPRHHAFDGKKIIPLKSPSIPVVIPPAYGLKDVGFETFTGDGPISYWNSYVGITQMGGKGVFKDPRIGLDISQSPDLVTPKLAALLEYQLSLPAPKPPAGTFNKESAERGERVFKNEAGCAKCHTPPTYTNVLSGADKKTPVLHDPASVGSDSRYAERSATRKFRATPLRGLWQHPPYFHDGRAADLMAVVNHYEKRLGLKLTAAQKADLVEFLKSL
jgi:hypothetical protein